MLSSSASFGKPVLKLQRPRRSTRGVRCRVAFEGVHHGIMDNGTTLFRPRQGTHAAITCKCIYVAYIEVVLAFRRPLPSLHQRPALLQGTWASALPRR
jgi:hypothetical protein